MPRPGLEPGPLDPECSALTIRPPCLPPDNLNQESFPFPCQTLHFCSRFLEPIPLHPIICNHLSLSTPRHDMFLSNTAVPNRRLSQFFEQLFPNSFRRMQRVLNIENQPLEPVNIKSSVTSRDNTALLCPVAAYVQTNGAGFPAGGRRGSIRPLHRTKRTYYF